MVEAVQALGNRADDVELPLKDSRTGTSERVREHHFLHFLSFRSWSTRFCWARRGRQSLIEPGDLLEVAGQGTVRTTGEIANLVFLKQPV